MEKDKAKALALIRTIGLEKLFKELSISVPENYSPVIQPSGPDEMQQILFVAAKYGIKFDF